MQSKNKFDFLNLIRVIAFLAIFMLHSGTFAPFDWGSFHMRYLWVIYTPAWAGVWIFIILSGYGIGHGFYQNKYELSPRGLIQYATKRLAKILPLYYGYLLVVLVFFAPERLFPNLENIGNLLKLIFFQYNESFGSREFGAVWYLSTIIKLYFIAPFVYYFIKRYLTSRTMVIFGIIALSSISLIVRLLWYKHLLPNDIGLWSELVYKPFYMNLDLFFVGFLLNAFKSDLKIVDASKVLKFIGASSLVTLLLINSYLYYYADCFDIKIYMFIYQYVFPSVYLIIIGYNILVFDVFRTFVYEKRSLQALKKNLLRIFDYFPKIMMPAYLIHSAILRQIQFVVDRDYTPYILHIQNVMNNILYRVGIQIERLDIIKHIFSSLLSMLITISLATLIAASMKSFNGKKTADWIYSNIKIKRIE